MDVKRHFQALSRFHSQIYQAVVRHFDLSLLKVVIIASPGFVNQAVYEHIFSEASVRQQRVLSYNMTLSDES